MGGENVAPLTPLRQDLVVEYQVLPHSAGTSSRGSVARCTYHGCRASTREGWLIVLGADAEIAGYSQRIVQRWWYETLRPASSGQGAAAAGSGR